MAAMILNETELRKHIALTEEALLAVEKAFTWITEGKAVMPPVMNIHIAENNGDVDIKSAYIKGRHGFAVKIASGFYNNRELGLPTGNGLVILIDAKVGGHKAIFLDNGYLTDIRTGLAGAVAAKYLAPNKVETAGVIGTGAQARFQLQSLKLVRNFKRLLVYGTSAEKMAVYRRDMEEKLNIKVVAAESAEQVVRESQLVVTTTPSRQAIIEADWLHPGLHITAMGSDGPGKRELEAKVLELADILVCDSKSQAFTIGEFQHAKMAALLTRRYNGIHELGEYTSGGSTGREHEEQITVCDLSGTGAQDTAIALYAYDKVTEG